MKKRLLLVAMTTMMIAILLLGCGGTEQTNIEPDESTVIEETVTITDALTEESLTETTEEAKTVESEQYTYADLDIVMYAKTSVNVRSLPTIDGEKVGGLSLGQEVYVTGQCNETAWYRIEYNGGVAYVSNSYLVNEEPVVPEERTTESISEPTMEAIPESTPEPSGSASGVNDSGSSSSNSGGVTVPEQEETGDNLVWVPTNGGTKYHSNSGCSSMKEPIQVTVETAVANGYTPCGRCYK